MPVFFIQDAIKFPDLVHSIKPEPDRDFPQAQAAHNTFWDFVSMTPVEKRHIVGGFSFELGKCDQVKIRTRMLGHLQHIDSELAEQVADALGIKGTADKIELRVPVGDPMPSPPLSQYSVAPESLAGKKIGLLTTDGVDASLYNSLVELAKNERATLEVIAPKIGPINTSQGKQVVPDHFLAGAPSVLFDCVVVAPAVKHSESLAAEATAIDWIRDAFVHFKVIGYNAASAMMFSNAHLQTDADEGLVNISRGDFKTFAVAAKKHRIWDRTC